MIRVTNPDKPFQFSLRTAFALTLWAAITLLIYRVMGPLATTLSAIAVFHLTVMAIATGTPGPASPAWDEFPGVGWAMLVPYIPFGGYLVVIAISRSQGRLWAGGLDSYLASLFLMLTILLFPVAVFCLLRANHLVGAALADRPRLKEVFLLSSVAVLGGMSFFLCVSCAQVS